MTPLASSSARPRQGALFVCVLAFSLAMPKGASAAEFDRLYDDYKGDQQIEACDYSAEELGRAQGEIPPDIEQYAPGFDGELTRAREKHARGGCAPKDKRPSPAEREAAPEDPSQGRLIPVPGGGGGEPPQANTAAPTVGEQGTTSATAAQPAASSPPAPPALPWRVVSGVASPELDTGRTGLPAAVWVLAVVALLAALAGAIAGLTRLYGWGAERLGRQFGVALAEVRARLSDSALEAWDTVRFGR